jgi:HAD superfamily hydrolase (TIGR01509 family)
MIKGLIFDLDGTVVDVYYDWPQIREALGTQGQPILTYLDGLAEPERSLKWKILEKYEDGATQKAKVKKGIPSFFRFLEKRGVKKALVTNNSRRNVSLLLRKFDLKFECVITRESGLWKPSAAPVLAAIKHLGLKQRECGLVGDSSFDVWAAEKAGIKKIFILSADRARFSSSRAEVYADVASLRKRIEELM